MKLRHPTLRVGVCLLVFGLLFGGSAATCRAKETCPWINEATAAGFLHGDVTVAVTHPPSGVSPTASNAPVPFGASITIGDATCEFARHDASGVTRLRVEVVTMKDVAAAFPAFRARCGAGSQPVRAIGNEAEVCEMPAAAHGVGDQVVGRVRERAFVVSISSGAGADQATLRETTLRVAEQVAGFLF